MLLLPESIDIGNNHFFNETDGALGVPPVVRSVPNIKLEVLCSEGDNDLSYRHTRSALVRILQRGRKQTLLSPVAYHPSKQSPLAELL